MQARFWHVFFLVFAAALIAGSNPAFAGTTGQLIGVVTDTTDGAPIVGAKVTAASPSGIGTAVTDATGHFTMLALVPDTYIVSIEMAGFEPTVVSGITITADGTRSLVQDLSHVSMSTGGRKERSGSSFLWARADPGYSVDAVTQSKTALAGGAGFVNSAYSALSTVPGVFVPVDQMGYDPSVSIRGGGIAQISYGIDGIPANRSYNDGPTGPASSLGQQELQVFTGDAPADSAVQGLSGVVNQVIRTGTIPGFATLGITLGGAGFDHQLAFESGGVTANRNFSYYIGLGGYDQAFRFADNFGGRGVSQLYGYPIEPCASNATCGNVTGTGVNAYNSYYQSAGLGSYLLGSGNILDTSQVNDRNTVVNLHLGIPRKDGFKDDVQFLGTVDYLKTYFFDSTNDLGGVDYLNSVGYGAPYYVDGDQLNVPIGALFPANYKAVLSPYFFPYSPTNRRMFAVIEPGLEDSQTNVQGIAKLQFTHPFSQNALLKVYGYTNYSNQFQDGPNAAYTDFDFNLNSDFEIPSRSRGLGMTFVDQTSARNQLQLAGSVTTTNTSPFINFEEDDDLYRAVLGIVVDSTNPNNGLCYAVTGGPPLSCADPNVGTANFNQARKGTIPVLNGTCGGGPCAYLVTANGSATPGFQKTPTYSAASITDALQVTRKLAIDGGLRVDYYRYDFANHSNGVTAFFLNADNLDNCIDAHGNLVPKAPTAQCAAGTTAAHFRYPKSNVTESSMEFEPRLRASYVPDRNTLVSASYSRITQPQNSSQQPDNTLNVGAPNVGSTPNRLLAPETSNNYDLSFEHTFGDDSSLRFTPFYRTTQNQLSGFYPTETIENPRYYDIAQQTARGMEFEFDKGHFDRDGLAGRFTATYTNSFMRYKNYVKGVSALDQPNAAIAGYNAYTSACAPGGKFVGKMQYGYPLCGATATGSVASACYSGASSAADGSSAVAGVAESCSVAGSVANPYWSAPAQGLIDPKGDFPTFQVVPSLPGTPNVAFSAPYVSSLVLNYKHGPFAVTPLMTLQAGQRYGAPESTFGVSPELCSGLSGPISGDPRYPYGNPGGAGFDATSIASQSNGCASGLVIPNPYDRKFDAFGGFTEPAIAQLQIEMTYDVSKNFELVAGLANVITECFGGSKEPWNVKGACSYGTALNADLTGIGDVGNEYNPGATIQPYINTPYLPTFAQAPFGFALGAKLKL